MRNVFYIVLCLIPVLLLTVPAHAEEVSKEQIKGLDEQVQEIKGDVLGIATQLNQLEEKLLYPSNTEVALFVSVAAKEKFRLDSVQIKLDGHEVADHLYTYKELEALREGGVQRIYTGNIRTGSHALEVTMIGKSGGGKALLQTRSFQLSKEVGPKIAEFVLSGSAITLQDR